MAIAAVTISVCALVFTIASFWWLHARRGHLMAGAPSCYAGAFSASRTRLRLPLVFYNTGPVPIVIERMRLRAGGIEELSWITLRTQLRPDPDDVVDFTSALVVQGRSTLQVFVEFRSNAPTWRPSAHEVVGFELDALTRGGNWKRLTAFELTMPAGDAMHRYIAHEGDPNRRTGAEASE